MWHTDISDRKLFAQDEFEIALNSSQSKLDIFKKTYNKGNEYLAEQFNLAKPIKDLIHKRAWFIDQLLIHAWQQHVGRSFAVPGRLNALICAFFLFLAWF